MAVASRLVATAPATLVSPAATRRASFAAAPKKFHAVEQPLDVVILAAGHGSRMRSSVSKVLQPVAGRPLLAHVFDAVAALSNVHVHVVVQA